MQEQIKIGTLRKPDVGQALYMSSQEKQISFYNKYFVVKKVRHVENVMRILSETKDATTPKLQTAAKNIARKLNKRINIEPIQL